MWKRLASSRTSPENLRSYFDAEAYLRDMKHGGEVTFEKLDGTVYSFRN